MFIKYSSLIIWAKGVLSASLMFHYFRKSAHSTGFSIAELLIYLGLFSAVALVFTGILTEVVDTNARNSSSNELVSQLNTVLAVVQKYVKESSQIEVYQDSAHLSSPTTTGSYLMIRTGPSSTDPTCIYLNGGAVKLAVGPDALNKSECTSQATDLTTNKVVADSLEFMVASQVGGHAFVKVDARFSANTTNPRLAISKEVSSAIGRANAAVFDSDLIPNSDNTFSIGQTSPDLRWRNGSFSGTVTLGTGASGGNLGIGMSTPGYQLSLGAPASGTTPTGAYLFGAATNGRQILIGQSYPAAIGTRYSGANAFLVTNAYQTSAGSDNWSRSATGYGSTGMFLTPNPLNTNVFSVLYSASSTPNGTYSNFFPTTLMAINSNGLVGIGTSIPSAKLQVSSGQILVDYGYGVQGKDSGGTARNLIAATSDLGGSTRISSLSASGGINFTNVSGSSLMTILDGGNVGIGTIAPGQKLDVIGNIKATGVIMPGSTSTPPTTCTTSSASSIYYNSSDTKMYYCNGTTWKVLGATASPPATGTITYITPGTYNWTVPDAVYRLGIKIIGAGGGGGGGASPAGDSLNISYGNGGGGGGLFIGLASVTPGESITITVGAGGSGGATLRTGGPGNNGIDGGNSSVATSGGTITVGGGKGGYGATATHNPGPIAWGGSVSGTAENTIQSTSGSNGGYGGTYSGSSGAGGAASGYSAINNTGYGGAPVYTPDVSGNAGGLYGGGGGGAGAVSGIVVDTYGGTGQIGKIDLWW